MKEITEDKDVFDKIMRAPGLRVFNPLFQRYREALLYLFFGGITVFLNIAVFVFLCNAWNQNELVANVIGWIMCVLFQFYTNRTWVFMSKTNTNATLIKQMTAFFEGRFFTLIVEELIIFVFITYLGFNSMIVKIAVQIIIIVLNYFISKMIVFKDKESSV